MAREQLDIADLLRPFGAPLESVISLDDRLGPQHLPHLDLRSQSTGSKPLVEAVVELQRRPILYVVRGPKELDEIPRLCHRLAQRGAADHLGVIEPGVLTIYPLLPVSNQSGPPRPIRAQDEQARSRIPSLAAALMAADAKGITRSRFEHQAKGTALELHEELFRLLNTSIHEIGKSRGVDDDDALSLVGRALFVRFLLDRGVISDLDVDQICSGAPSLVECMADPVRVQRTCRWLDHTFNGDLLPLSRRGGRAFWANITSSARDRICAELSKILHKAEPTGQLRFEWATLDFGHIPVGLLSEVYEGYYHDFKTEEAKEQSVHYTPRAIAEYMVDEALYALPQPHAARILDPAVGAGVFLVSAFRALVAAQWQATGRRPQTASLRKILYRQLVGFDINEVALRLTALSLYLAALELDPAPMPLDALRFEDLRGRVLFDVRSRDDRDGQTRGLPILGSLGAHIPAEHRGAYDVVLGNPPWTSWKRSKAKRKSEFDARVRTVEKVVQGVVDERFDESENARFKMVGLDPDVPFCWRAAEWAKPGGRIAFALHGRVLFKRSDVGEGARSLLFRGLRVTGILNGTAVRETRVWPSVKTPFCLCFAENRRPGSGDGFNFVSPVEDRGLNHRGHLRIDADDAHRIECHEVPKTPWLLKTLFRGTMLDAAVVRTLSGSENPALSDYLSRPLGGVTMRTGYQVGSQRRDTNREFLYELKDHGSGAWNHGAPFCIDVQSLPDFRHPTVEEPRTRDVYRSPLVLVTQARGNKRDSVRAKLCWSDVAFSKTFFGISVAGHQNSELLARYLHLVLNSNIFLYFALMQSGKFGVERYVLEQQDLERMPIRSLDSLDTEEKARVRELSERLLSLDHNALETNPPWRSIDETVAALYGLNRWDVEVINDTLEVSLPYESSRDRAEQRPSAADTETFVRDLERHLTAIVTRLDRKLSARIVRAQTWEPWIFVRVTTWPSRGAEPKGSVAAAASFIDFMTAEADRYGATRIVHREPTPGVLTIGIFAQYRYWTRTRARLLALDLLQAHEAPLMGETAS